LKLVAVELWRPMGSAPLLIVVVLAGRASMSPTISAYLMRAGRLEELDLDHIAEELDDVGSEIYRRLEGALTVLYTHMLKGDFQPNHRSRSWEASIREQRSRIAKLLAKNPSLKSKLDEAREEAYEYGRDRPSGETGLPMDAFPETSPYTWQEVTEREFLLEEAPIPKPLSP
jgi:hypothetical protein